MSEAKARSFGGMLMSLAAVGVPLIASYQVWVTTQIYDLRECRAMSQKVNLDQDAEIKNQYGIIAIELRDMRSDLKGLTSQVDRMAGILDEHTKGEPRPIRKQSDSRLYPGPQGRSEELVKGK